MQSQLLGAKACLLIFPALFSALQVLTEVTAGDVAFSISPRPHKEPARGILGPFTESSRAPYTGAARVSLVL